MIQSRRYYLFTLAALLLSLSRPALAEPLAPAERIEGPGAGNLYKVTPTLYRSAQPTAEGFAFVAKKLGVKTVVSLRTSHSDVAAASGAGLKLRHVPIDTWHIGDDDGGKIVAALRYIRRGEARGPVLVHCTHGSDRTGAVIALYRILYQGVSKEDAIAEMMDGGFGFSPVWKVLPAWGNIPGYIRGVDVAELRARVAK